MKILFTAFTGYNYRELVLPLVPHLDNDNDIHEALVVTPAATHRDQLLPDLGRKYITVPVEPDQPSYEQLFKKHQPDIVVTPTAGLEPNDIPVLKAAKQVQIPTLTFIASWDNVYKMERVMQLQKYEGKYAIADKFAVWNTTNRDHLLRMVPKITEEQVVITGPPRFDLLTRDQQLPSREEVCQALGLNDHLKKYIHVATTELYSSDYLVKALAKAQNGKLPNNTSLLVSVHPGGNLEKHKAYCDPYSAHVFYSFGRKEASPVEEFLYAPTMHDLRLHAAFFRHMDVLVNHSSTVTIESIVADTPVVTIKYGRPFDWWQWRRSMIYRDFQQHARVIIKSGATKVATSRAELINAVATYLENPQENQQERRHLSKTLVTQADGSAGERLLDAIKKTSRVKPSL